MRGIHFSISIVFFCLVSVAKGQTYLVPAFGNDTVVITSGSSFTVLDAGGDGYYPDHCDGALTILSSDTTPITVTGFFFTEYNNDFLYIYNGTPVNGALAALYSGMGQASVTAVSGVVTIRFTSNSMFNQAGFSLTVSACGVVEEGVSNIAVSNVTSNSAVIDWTDTSSATAWTIRYGTDPGDLTTVVTSDSNSVILEGLAPYTIYHYCVLQGSAEIDTVCGVKTRTFKTLCDVNPPSCIDYCSLSSCYTTACYGTYLYPDQHRGVVDYGSDNALSRHTVNSDTSARDPRTGNQLRIVPQGYTSSVRLGNWLTGGEAECITYEYHVDTIVSDLLIMKYAAVLQDPSHSDDEQPKFLFRILDEDGEEINGACYSADFVAGDGLGWNTVYSVSDSTNILWKDWTSVGVDLTGLHGQTIKIKLATYDCNRHDHYGYAYFVFDCGNKKIEVENCGSVENTLIAPEGFGYNWYCDSMPGVTLSTDRTLHVTHEGEYHCTLSFTGAGDGTSCSFVLTALAESRMTNDTSVYDTVVQNALPYPFGDSLFHHDADNIEFHFTNRDGCDSTVHFSLHVWHNVVNDADSIICQNLLPLAWNGIVFDTGDFSATLNGNVATRTACFSAAEQHGADSILNMTVLLLRNSSMERFDTLVENSLPISIGGMIFDTSSMSLRNGVTQIDSTWTIANVAGCDSAIHYNLYVWPNRYAHADSTLCENALPMTWNNVLFQLNDSSTQQATINLSGLGVYALHGEDSILTMSVHVLRNSAFSRQDTIVQNSLPVTFGGVTFDTNSFHFTSAPSATVDSSWIITNVAGCDSQLHYTLTVWRNYLHYADSTVCDSQLPLNWDNTVFSKSDFDSWHQVDVCSKTLYLSTTNGADSTVTLTLTVNPTYTANDTSVICYGDSTAYGMFSSGDYALEMQTRQGCDSVIFLNVVVNPVFNLHFADTICSNQSSFFDGHYVDSEGLHTAAHTTVEGCDSTLSLQLTVHPTWIVFDNVQVCDGVPYTWIDGNSYTHTTYEPTVTYSDQYGCDSTRHLILDIVNGFQADMRITPTIASYANPDVELRDISKSVSREWHYNDDIDTARVCVFTFPANADSIPVLMVARNALGCIDSVLGMVFFDRYAIWPPNAFTPDEQTNNRFFIPCDGIANGEVSIFNRQGLHVATFDLLNGSWDGTSKGIPCPQAAYTWIMTYSTKSQPNLKRQGKGTVTLIR